MAPTPFPIPQGSSGGRGKGGTGTMLGLSPKHELALVLGLVIGPFVVYILFGVARRVIGVYLYRRSQRRAIELPSQTGLPNENISWSTTTLVDAPAPVPAAHLPAEVTRIPTDAIINYWATPRDEGARVGELGTHGADSAPGPVTR